MNITPAYNPEYLTRPKYRADIDGLRAIAILSVVGFHAFPSLVRGGFIGVDMFFVISGFLISTIIFGSLDRNNFSFLEFYSRRIKRIFPALILVFSASYIFGWFELFADEYKQLGKHIAAGAGFVANFILWNENGYFDNTAESKPMLHLWSLGIEEQFYIVWPLLLWFAWKRKLNMLSITIAIGLISFALNIATVRTDAVAVFYSPQTRFWELLVGSVLAYITLYKQGGRKQSTSNLQSIVGAALIAIAFFVIKKELAFPGWWAMLPTMGVALIISAGLNAWLNRAVLSNRILVWFGLISFPLYLWHWPLLSFAHIVGSAEPTREMRIAAVLISIMLAWLTYELIEKPIRFGTKNRGKTLALFALMIVAFGLGYNCYKQDGFEGSGFRIKERTEYYNYFINSMPELKYFRSNGIAEKYRTQCDLYNGEEVRIGQSTVSTVKTIDEVCIRRDSHYSNSVLLWGDSHAEHLYFGLKNHLPPQYQILQLTSSRCLPDINAKEPSTTDYCVQSNWLALKTMNDIKPDVVIVAQSLGHTIETFNRIAEKVNSLGISKIIFVGPTPHWLSNLPNIIIRRLWPDTPNRTFISIDEKVLKENAALEKGFTRSGTKIFANLIDLFCNESGCLTYLGDDKKVGITSWDSGHLTPVASDYVAKELLVNLIIDGGNVESSGVSWERTASGK
jgi:peptidoglycan/LPS O-acetylase OafA/YrhL